MNQVVNRSAKITGLVIVIAISALGYRWGNRSARTMPISSSFLITGDSMAPTLHDGEICHVLAVRSQWRAGDVVAIQWGGRQRVKRLAATGGDTVDLVGGRLVVNERRLEDILAERTGHETSDHDFIAPGIVHVSSNQEHWIRSKTFPNWIVYTHHNPHQANQVTPVMDDYPINSSVRRALNPVDRLVVKVHPVDSKAVSGLRTILFAGSGFNATFIRDGSARSRPAQSGDAEAFGERQAVEEIREVIESLDASHPIAIQIKSAQQREYRYHVYREIEYRDDRPNGAVKYPVRLSDDEVFVVGDNSPVSVDSRQIGPLKQTAILGRVIERGR